MSGYVKPLKFSTIPVRWQGLVTRWPVKVGDSVKKGDLLAEVDMRYVKGEGNTLKAKLHLLEVQLLNANQEEKKAKEQLNRKRVLASQQVVALSAAEKEEVNFVEAQLRRVAVEKQIRQQKELISENEAALVESNYYAPTDGILSELIVDPRQVMGVVEIKYGQVLGRIDQEGDYLLKAYVVDTLAAKLKVKQRGILRFDGVSKEIPCHIENISNSDYGVKENLPLFEVSILFRKPPEIRQRTLLAKVEFIVNQKENALSLPWNAIRLVEGKHTVVVRRKDGATSMQNVVLGIRGPNRVEIASGLTEGDDVEIDLW